MNSNVLLEKFLTLLIEDNATLIKWASGSTDPLVRWLAKHNIVPIPSGEKDYLLGAGTAARAYSIIWKGKESVAKFINSNEIDIYNKLSNLKKDLPNIYARHIMDVYDTIKVDSKTTQDAEDQFGKVFNACIIVEKLDTLHSKVADTMWRSLKSSDSDFRLKNSIKALLDNEEKLDKILSVVNISKKNQVFYRKILISCLTDIINVKQLDTKNKRVEIALKILSKKIDKLKELNKIPDNIISNTKLYLTPILKQISGGDIFPTAAFSDNSLSDKIISDPRALSLLKCFRYLRDNYNIEWLDASRANIMVRPKTKEYVVSDAGSFLIG